MYVGYMYTSGQVHGLGSSSTIKGAVDTWYQNNIANNSEYTNKISPTTGFCGDRSDYRDATGTTSGGGTNLTYYGAYIRYINDGTPTYDCPNDSDLYTVAGSGVGNEALTNPVGLITMDEVWYAGGNTPRNSSYYLYTDSEYWTMSPSCFDGSYAHVFLVNSHGTLGFDWVFVTLGVRPVLNLKADVQLTGSGSASDPFTVV